MTCTVIINNKIDAEAEAVAAALKKANQYIPTAKQISIHCKMRNPADAISAPNWLEYGIFVEFESGSTLYLAMIQRAPGNSFEFHS